MFLSQKFSTFLPFILGDPIPYYPREEGRNSAQNGEKEITLKWMRHRSLRTQVIQTGLFDAWLDDFVPKSFRLFNFYTGRSNSVLHQTEGGRKQHGLEMWRRDSPKSGWDTGVSDLGAFKLDHLQPFKLILSQNVTTFPTFILGGSIPYYPRERKAGRSRGLKWEREVSKSGWDQGVSDPGAFKLDNLQPVKLI